MVSPAKTMTSTPATLTCPAEANASDSESHKNEGLTADKETEKAKCLSGFIFLCNQSTKLECYRYRVFGLPLSQKKVVGEIKSGMKLFLFDFELKLLYGVYEATSTGNLDLEPAAFGGKFPAQVQFRIFKGCLPIPESSLKYVIKENCTGTKFKQELSEEQVTKLISSFRPLAGSSWQPSSQALANVSLPRAMPPPVMENQLKLTGRLPVMEFPHLAKVQYSHVRPLVDPHSVLNGNYLEHGSHRKATYVENVHPTLDHRSFPAASSYYAAYPQRPLFAEDVARGVQEPSYSRYTTMGQRAPHDGVTISERQYHQPLLQREALYQDNVAAYNSYSTATNQYTPSVLQTQLSASSHQLPLQGRQYQDSIAAYSSNPAAPAQHTTSDSQQQVPDAYLPLQKEASHQDNLAAYRSNLIALAQYASSVMQQQVPVPYDQSTFRGTQFQDSAVAYSSNPAAPAQYTPSVLQPQVQATYLPQQRESSYQENAVPYNSNPTVPAQYSSITQPQVSGVNVAAYNSNPTVPAQYYSITQPQVSGVNVAAYNSNPIVPAQYSSITQPQVSGVNVAAYNSNPMAVDHYNPSQVSAPISSHFQYSAADHHPSH